MYGWAADIYGEDLISPKVLQALMANRQAIQKPNTEGFNTVQFISRFDALTPEEQENTLKPTEIEGWVNNIFGIDLTSSARILAILRHEQFRPLVYKYCMTRYGERHFNWTLMEAIIQAKLDTVSKSLY
jgi:hypothetical protein